MKLAEKILKSEEKTPGIYMYSRSGLVNTWYVRLDKNNEEYILDDVILNTVIETMYHYLESRYGSYRVLGVFKAESGLYVLTRFISDHMIFGAIIDYIMELQCMISTNRDRTLIVPVRDISRTKAYMLSYYDNYLRYQNSAMKYKN